jgi:hypothetical protein
MASASQHVTTKAEDRSGHQFTYQAVGSTHAVELYGTLLGVLRQHPAANSGIPPTGEPVEVRGLSLWRFGTNDKVEEIWSIQNQFSLLQQIGVISPDFVGAQVPSPAAPTDHPA